MVFTFFAFKPFFNTCCTCLFHVQYDMSASVTLHKLLCKYQCLSLNYCFRSELSGALDVSPQCHHRKKKTSVTILKCFWDYRPRKVFFTKCVCVLLCLFQKVRAICAKQTFSTSWPSCIVKHRHMYFLFSYVGVMWGAAYKNYDQVWNCSPSKEVWSQFVSHHHSAAGL